MRSSWDALSSSSGTHNLEGLRARHLKQSGIRVGEACLIEARKHWAASLLIGVQQGVLQHKESYGTRILMALGVLSKKDS